MLYIKKGEKEVQGVPQSQAAAFPDTKRKRKQTKLKQAQIKQTYEMH